MKKFHFSLERVRLWRAMQLETAEAKLEGMIARREAMNGEETALEARRVDAGRGVWSGGSAEASHLRALDDFHHFLAAERLKLRERMAACNLTIAAQRARVIEERRGVKLLDHLKDRRLAVWERAANLEIETIAAESYNSRFMRKRRLSLNE